MRLGWVRVGGEHGMRVGLGWVWQGKGRVGCGGWGGVGFSWMSRMGWGGVRVPWVRVWDGWGWVGCGAEWLGLG